MEVTGFVFLSCYKKTGTPLYNPRHSLHSREAVMHLRNYHMEYLATKGMKPVCEADIPLRSSLFVCVSQGQTERDRDYGNSSRGTTPLNQGHKGRGVGVEHTTPFHDFVN